VHLSYHRRALVLNPHLCCQSTPRRNRAPPWRRSRSARSRATTRARTGPPHTLTSKGWACALMAAPSRPAAASLGRLLRERYDFLIILHSHGLVLSCV
jgi:hypothetical protein